MPENNSTSLGVFNRRVLLSTWLNCAHVSKIDIELNRTMRIITGTVKSTPLEWLPAWSNIATPNVRRQSALLMLYRKATSDQRIPLHHDLLANSEFRLKSRRPPVTTAKTLHINGYDHKTVSNEIWLAGEANSQLFDFNRHTSKSKEFQLYLGKYGATWTDCEQDMVTATKCCTSGDSPTIRAAVVETHIKPWTICFAIAQYLNTMVTLTTSST